MDTETTMLSDFAREMFDRTRAMIREEYRDRLEVTSSSASEEPDENFIQEYAMGGEPMDVYMIGFVGFGIYMEADWFAIKGASCDDPLCEEYDDFYHEWKKSKYGKGKRSMYMDETGPVFHDINDAMDFVRDFRGMDIVLSKYLDDEDAIIESEDQIDTHEGRFAIEVGKVDDIKSLQ